MYYWFSKSTETLQYLEVVDGELVAPDPYKDIPVRRIVADYEGRMPIGPSAADRKSLLVDAMLAPSNVLTLLDSTKKRKPKEGGSQPVHEAIIRQVGLRTAGRSG